MKNILLLLVACFFAFTGQAQNKKKQDIEAIMAMCGCYEITFNFAETFAPDKAYEFHENYRSGGLEYVFPVEQGKDKIVLQHLLIVGDTMIIKHWRQDWIFENSDFYFYDMDNSWIYNKKPAQAVKGQWTQKVFQVDDSPRYEGSASWVHVDGKHFWENTADAPLPRREHTKRDDYNVMVRKNRHEIKPFGWVHEQDNDKVIRSESGDQLLAQEKGMNTYKKVESSKCKVAKDWWSRTSVYWADVRFVWDELFASKKEISLKRKVGDELLFMKLFALQDMMLSGSYDSEESKTKIRLTIQEYLNSDQKLASSK